jgi:flagellar basal-body rod modification protein FlgD
MYYSGGVQDILPKSYEAMKEERLKRSTGGDELGQEQFLNLLIEQMKNQDPLDPMDNAEFTQQTTAFSQLEQIMNIGDTLNALAEMQGQQTQVDQNLMASASFIGKTVEYDTNVIKVNSSGAAGAISYYAAEGATSGRITLYNSEGSIAAVVDSGAIKQGNNSFKWDSAKAQGIELQEGMYSFEVEAYDKDGNPIEVAAYGESQVKGITISGGKMYFEVDNGLVPAETVYSVKETPAAPVEDDKEEDK